jgi:hypothetical protein
MKSIWMYEAIPHCLIYEKGNVATTTLYGDASGTKRLKCSHVSKHTLRSDKCQCIPDMYGLL